MTDWEAISRAKAVEAKKYAPRSGNNKAHRSREDRTAERKRIKASRKAAK